MKSPQMRSRPPNDHTDRIFTNFFIIQLLLCLISFKFKLVFLYFYFFKFLFGIHFFIFQIFFIFLFANNFFYKIKYYVKFAEIIIIFLIFYEKDFKMK